TVAVRTTGRRCADPFERAEVVVRRARPAVEREQRCRRRVEVSHEPVPRPGAAAGDVSLARPHRAYHPRTNALLAQLVEHLHGKEGVSGSSPEEGSAKAAQDAGYSLFEGRGMA